MQITIDRGELDKAITWAARAVSMRPAVPVLASIRLEISAGRLDVGAFDYEVTAKAAVFGESDGAGVILVGGKRLASAVKGLPKGTARKPVPVTLTATWPEPAAVPDLPEGEQHEFSTDQDTAYPHLVYAQCSCGGWDTSGAMRDYVAREGHKRHLRTDAPEFAAAIAARAEAENRQPGTLTVECGGVSVALPDVDPAGYPAFPPLPALAGTFTADALARSFNRVAAAAGTDETLPVLTHVAFELGESEVTMAATDRYRLAVDSVAWTPADLGSDERTVLLPAKAGVQFLKAAAGAGKIALHYDAPAVRDGEDPRTAPGGFAALVTDERELIVRTDASGNFPTWRNLLPAGDDTMACAITVDSAAMIAALNRAGKAGWRNGRTVLDVMPLDLHAGQVTVRATGEGGEFVSAETLPVEHAGDALAPGFNAGYLASLLAGIDGAAEIGFRDEKRPAFIRPADRTDTFRALICSIRNGSA